MKKALNQGFDIANKMKKRKIAPTLILLTDGDPTDIRYRSRNSFFQEIQRLNNDLNMPIFSIAFGNNSDFEFLQQLSSLNKGYVKKIFPSGSSFQQLENFYKNLADLKMKKVTFKYQINNKILTSYTQKVYERANGYKEYLTVGQYEPCQRKGCKDRVVTLMYGKTGNHTVKSTSYFKTCRNGIQRSPFGPYRCLHGVSQIHERLWAFKRINWLLKEDPKSCQRGIFSGISADGLNRSICQEEALNLALEYNFVTDLTSFVVESSEAFLGILNQRSNPVSMPDLQYQTNTAKSEPDLNKNATCAIILYDKTHLRGNSVPLYESVSDLALVDFDDKLLSLKVVGGCRWAVYTDANFMGAGRLFAPREEYGSVMDVKEVLKKASSVEKL